MVLATCAKDLKFYSWPEISLLGIYGDSTENSYIRNLSWDGDGNYVVAVKSNGHNVILKAPVKIEENIQPLVNIKCQGSTVATFSSLCSNKLALGTGHGEIKIYDIKEKEIIADYKSLPSSVQNLEFLKHDACLAVGCNNGQVILYNRRKEPCSTFSVPYSSSLTAMISHHMQQNLLAACGKEGVICVWDVEKSQTKLTTKNHTGIVTDMAFFGDTITSVSVDNNFIVYDLRDARQVAAYNLNSPLSGVSYHSNREVAVSTCDGQLRSYDTRFMATPMHIVVAYNCWIKKIAFPQVKPIPPSLAKCRNSLFNEDLSPASGDFSTPNSRANNNDIVPSSEVIRTISDVFYSKEDEKITKEELSELMRDLDKHLKARKSEFEEKMLQRFYMLRIEGSKQFINLEDQVNESWANFIEYLKFTGGSKKSKSRIINAKK